MAAPMQCHSYMTSNPNSWGEGWSFVDNLSFDQLCAADLSGSGHKLPVRPCPLVSLVVPV